jgi:predicted adenine nucleotide alpha hydrolase (AANH) superfamily ATPase
MAFSEKLKDMLSKGFEASKDILEKAGAKAKELGELGVLKLEIIQLKSQAQKAAAHLGAEVYSTFMEKGQKSLTPDSATIKDLLQKLDQLEKDIDSREEEFKKKGGKEEELEAE